MRHRLPKPSTRILRNDRPPKRHRRLVIKKLHHFPLPREAIENQLRRIPSRPQPPRLRTDKKLRHPIIHLLPLIPRRTTHQRKPDRLIVFKNDQRMRTVIREPSRHQLHFSLSIFPGRRKHARVHAQAREVFEVFGVLLLDPGAVLVGALRVADADWHLGRGSSCAASLLWVGS